MKILVKLVLFVIMMLLVACSNVEQCISLSGDYKGINGQIDYCWNKAASEKAGTVILDGSDGAQLIGIDEEQLKEVNDAIESKIAGSISAKETEDRNDFKNFQLDLEKCNSQYERFCKIRKYLNTHK